jgi:hypothetical protein
MQTLALYLADSTANVLTAAQQMMALGKPDETDRENVGRYIYNRNCLIDGEASWIQQRDDLITLRVGREHTWFDGVVEGILKTCHCRLIDTIFGSEVTYPQPSRYQSSTNKLPGNSQKSRDRQR